MNSQIDLQKKFFNHLVYLKGHKTVLPETMQVLHLQKGAVYKRMNGETALTLAELTALAKHFRISLDDVLLDGDQISFRHPEIPKQDTQSIDFLALIDAYFKMLNRDRSSKFLQLANEIPLSYYLSRKLIILK